MDISLSSDGTEVELIVDGATILIKPIENTVVIYPGRGRHCSVLGGVAVAQTPMTVEISPRLEDE